jgi:hypothetical protein
MRAVSDEIATALAAGGLDSRDFIWFVVKERDTGAPVVDGYWSDVGPITCEVLDPDTGGAQSREFFGANALIDISDIEIVMGITVQTVTVTLSQCADRVNNLIRTYECKYGRVEVFRGLFDPDSGEMVGPAWPRFLGFINHIEVTTPPEGDEGDVVLSCVSHAQELTRSNPDTRCDASQRLRHPDDGFYKDVVTVADWEVNWGVSTGTVGTISMDEARRIAGGFV